MGAFEGQQGDLLEARVLEQARDGLGASPDLQLGKSRRRDAGDPGELDQLLDSALAIPLEPFERAIPEIVDAALQEGVGNVDDVAGVLEADRVARERAEKTIANRPGGVKRTEAVG
jgi:hypothetical protein